MKRQSTSDLAYKEIRRRIVEWDFAPLEHLIEEQLVEQLSFSRTPLRQALYRLELEGLVYKASNGRIHVVDISLEHAKEIYKAREVLESILAREACMNMTSKNLHLLKEKIHLMKLAALEKRNMDVVNHGLEFHSMIREFSQNETLSRFLRQIEHHVDRYRRVGGKFNPLYDPERPIREHQLIYEAFSNRDPNLVEKRMAEHIKNSYLNSIVLIENYFTTKQLDAIE
ncbi:GntR family transcriptional regulator [Ureibacillus composti]